MEKILNEKLAKVLLQVGVNLQKGENVLLQTDTNALDLAREITRQAYELGANDVQVRIDDPYINHERIKAASKDTLRKALDWEKESIDSVLKDGNGVQLGVSVSYPELNKDVDSENLLAFSQMKNDLRNIVRNYIHKGVLKWTGTVYPGLEWARKVYPELSDEEAYKALEEAICLMMRVDKDSDPLENWKKHCDELSERSAKLNAFNFK
ncbi:MAG: aminopeptidase, partial [Erysipelotrichaceae bacterium]|nr:aminopeptidase [Erysipelotrichaceae bacterium]